MAYNIRKAWGGKNASRKRKNTVKKIVAVAKKGYSISQSKEFAVLASQVKMLAGMINAEKKRIDYSNNNTTLYLGQVTVNSANYYTLDITPAPAEGVTISTRNGGSIKLCSSFFRFQFLSQSGFKTAIKLRMQIVLVKGSPQSTGTVATQMYQPNPFIYNGGSNAGIIDYNSTRDPDYFGQYKVLMTKLITIPCDNYTSAEVVKDVSFGMKYFRGKGHHIRYNDDTTTVSNGQLVLLITADSGNSGGASTLTGITTQTASSALTFSYNYRHYYYDN